MISRFLLWSLIIGVALAGGLTAWREGQLAAWGNWLNEWRGGGSDVYTTGRFRVDLVDRLNYTRIAAKIPVLKMDPELDTWLETHFPDMVLDDMNAVTKQIEEALPRYFRVSVCTASGPTLRVLLDQFQDFSQRPQPEMTHMGCVVRKSAGGLGRQALIVVGERLKNFSPEVVTQTKDEAFFSRCPHCNFAHIVRVKGQLHSLGLECPKCRRTYAMVAADEAGHFRYVNEFLTGYAPPAVFAKDQSRVYELFTIWSAVHSNCSYQKDAGVRKEQTDTWQTSLETQRRGRGDCEDSAIYLCDWLLSRGFQARVALGRYGDLGGHAWVVVKLEDKEYLLESTEGRPDPSNPPLVSRVGSRYVPEIMFDRFAIYVRAVPGQAWKGDYWSGKTWIRVEPRKLNPGVDPLATWFQHAESEQTDPSRLARTTQPNPSAAPFLELQGIPVDADVWRTALPLGEGITKP